MRKAIAKEVVRVIPLGGQGEIGKNAWVLEHGNQIVIINFGLMLPPPSLAGVDLILPNTNYLIENQDKIQGLIVTSAHDDCCGGVPYLLSKIKIPKIWSTKLAAETIKLQCAQGQSIPEIEHITSRQEFQIGNFAFTAMRNTSTLPDTYGLYVKSQAGTVLHTGPYKVDQTPPDKCLFDYYMYSKAGEDGVDVLISDSTNIEAVGYSQSEVKIVKRFDEIFKEHSSRIVIVSYASNIHKFKLLFDLALKNKKKICLSGEYLINKIDAAINAACINLDKKIFVKETELASIKDKNVVIFTSGKYGDFMSVLIEIAKQEHQNIKLEANDTVVISSNPPPGTTRLLAHTVDQFFVQKIQVVGGRGQGVHVSGHAAQEEAKFMLTVAKPRSFVPAFGEERQLVKYESIAEMMNINANDIHIVKNGDVLELREQVARVANKIPAQSIYYNHAKGFDIDELTMNDRLALSEEGTITVALALDKKRNIVAGPEILAEACSFAKGKDWRAFCLGVVELVKDAVKQSVERDETELLNLKAVVRDTVNKSVLELIGRRPLINVSIQEIGKASEPVGS